MTDNERPSGGPRWDIPIEGPEPRNLIYNPEGAFSLRWINKDNISLLFVGIENKVTDLVPVTVFLASGAKIQFVASAGIVRSLFQ